MHAWLWAGAAFVGVVLSLALVSWLVHLQTARRLRRTQQQGLMWLGRLREILAQMQRHRGVSYAWHHGSKSMAQEREQLQRQLDQRLTALSAELPWLASNERWLGITDHWQRLGSSSLQLHAEDCLAQHNNLIQNVLYLIEDLALQFRLSRLRLANGLHVRILWRELLAVAECVGQVRALGSGACADGYCDSVTRIRLNYLREQVEHASQAIWQQLPPSREQKNALQALLGCLDRVLLRGQVDLGATEFFQLASHSLDALHAQYDDAMLALQR